MSTRRSQYRLMLDGWDEHSSWGYDPDLGSFYAHLNRNGHPDDAAVRIAPPVYLRMPVPEVLALLLARATGVDAAEVHAAMRSGLDAENMDQCILEDRRGL